MTATSRVVSSALHGLNYKLIGHARTRSRLQAALVSVDGACLRYMKEPLDPER